MFNGPIFIVGRPRSGTKLLRSLLNLHSQISIPFWESNFIPQNIEKAQTFGELSDFANFSQFFDYFTNIEFFRMISNHPDYSDIVSVSKWYEKLESYTYAGAIKAFFVLYAQQDHKSIWGDKSPHYMLWIKDLKAMFPSAKFIHIIRDVRDHCLSSQKAWNKNPYRSAKMWNEAIIKCRNDAELYLGEDYYELKYEDLIEHTESLLSSICRYLKIEFETRMLKLDKPAENLGDTKNNAQIVKTNKDKWRSGMDNSTIKRIEEISYHLLRDLNYDIVFANKQSSLSSFEMFIATLQDAFNRFRFDCKFQGGVLQGIKYQYYKKRYG